MIKDILKTLGLDDAEIAVYLVILKYKKATPAFIARHSKISRPTIYNICERLFMRGFLVRDHGERTLTFAPTPPLEMGAIIKKERAEVDAREKVIKDLVSELAALQSEDTYPVPKIRFVEQEGILDYLYARREAWDDSVLAHRDFWWGFQDHTFVERYQEWIDWYWQNNPRCIRLRLFSNTSKIEERVGPRYTLREIRPWTGGERFTATTWVNGDYLVMVVTDKEPHYLVEIHDARLAENQRTIFKRLWESAS